MTRNEQQVQHNRDYFAAKLAATKQRHDVLTAVESGTIDFVLSK